MTPQTARRIIMLAGQLSDALMTASLCAEEIRGAILANLDDGGEAYAPPQGSRLPASDQQQRPLLDEPTMSVIWKGASLHLDHGVPFKLLCRLAHRPNQYVTHLESLRDAWDGEERETAAIRSTVRHLQAKLRADGMAELAAAIRGHNGRYVLDR